MEYPCSHICPTSLAATVASSASGSLTLIYLTHLFINRQSTRTLLLLRLCASLYAITRMIEIALPPERLAFNFTRAMRTMGIYAAAFQWNKHVVDTGYMTATLSKVGPHWNVLVTRAQQAVLVVFVPIVYFGFNATEYPYCNTASMILHVYRMLAANTTMVSLCVCHLLVVRSVRSVNLSVASISNSEKRTQQFRQALRKIRVILGFLLIGCTGYTVQGIVEIAQREVTTINCDNIASDITSPVVGTIAVFLLLWHTDSGTRACCLRGNTSLSSASSGLKRISGTTKHTTSTKHSTATVDETTTGGGGSGRKLAGASPRAYFGASRRTSLVGGGNAAFTDLSQQDPSPVSPSSVMPRSSVMQPESPFPSTGTFSYDSTATSQWGTAKRDSDSATAAVPLASQIELGIAASPRPRDQLQTHSEVPRNSNEYRYNGIEWEDATSESSGESHGTGSPRPAAADDLSARSV